MGKNNRHKKFLKSEKSKVKLKAKQKILPKGQNVTDTSFKLKKITMPTQQQIHGKPEDQALTKRNLSLKDLLSRSKNNNANVKNGALDGLHELAENHQETFSSNLCHYIETSAALCGDTESSVRQEALRLLNYTLEKATTAQLEPFMPLLVSYLSVGMSHLNQGIQSDALRMLDIVLAVAPNLVARAASLLLPAFLDQISVKRNTVSTSRNLSVNLNSTNTSTRWRIQVLGRLHAMLCAVMTSETTSVQDQGIQHWSSAGSNYLTAPLNLVQWDIDDPCEIQGLFTSGPSLPTLDLFKNEEEMKKYILVLMPLLFDTWMEVGPSHNRQQEKESEITQEAAELLECVLEIIQNLWTLLEMTDQKKNNNELTQWFQRIFKDQYVRHIMSHFPYVTAVESKKKKGMKHKGQAPLEDHLVQDCTNQNLAVCHVLCCLCINPTNEQKEDVLSYTKKFMTFRHMPEQLIKVIQFVLASKQWNCLGADGIAGKAIKVLFMQPEQDISKHLLFSILCDASLVAAHKNTTSVTKPDQTYDTFIGQLPMILTFGSISAKGIDTITRLVSMKNTTLLLAIKFLAPKIISNIPAAAVEGVSRTLVQSNIVQILYCASAWRSDILNSVVQHIFHHSVSPDVRRHFLEMLKYELQPKKPDDPVLAEKIHALATFNLLNDQMI